MKEVIKYIAYDGKEFSDKDACMKYEKNIIFNDNMLDCIEKLHNICNERHCEECILYDVCGEDWFRKAPHRWDLNILTKHK